MKTLFHVDAAVNLIIPLPLLNRTCVACMELGIVNTKVSTHCVSDYVPTKLFFLKPFTYSYIIMAGIFGWIIPVMIY